MSWERPEESCDFCDQRAIYRALGSRLCGSTYCLDRAWLYTSNDVRPGDQP